MRSCTKLATIGLTLTLVGCGRSNGNQDAKVADCLRTVLLAQVLGEQNGCGPLQIPAPADYQLTILCTHETGDQYTCQATAPTPQYGDNPMRQAAGTYQVAFDGHTISYQQQ